MKWLIILIFLYTPISNAYLQKVGGQGRGLFWLPRNISYALNTSGCNSDISSEMERITKESIYEWGSITSLNLKVDITSQGPSTLVNDINCAPTGSSAVVGITKIIYNEGTGQIIEADITLNSEVDFNTATDTSFYVGNVLTHEIGHSIGFDHSEGFRSSMFYSLFLGQSTLSPDDKAGAYSIYPTGPLMGEIQGNVIGGTADIPIGIFGAFVQAFSTDTGELMGSAVTKDDGSFSIKGLPMGDQYFLYVKPLELLSTISKYYSSARSDFCGDPTSRPSYRGTFFTECGNTTTGYPQGIYLDSPIEYVGSISAYCELREIKLNEESFYEEDSSRIFSFRDLELHGYLTELDFGSTFVSYFTGQQLIANEDASKTSYQEFEINLVDIVVPGTNTYLDIKLNSQSFYSQIQLEMQIRKNYQDESEQEIFYFSSVNDDGSIKTNPDGSPELNLIGRVPLTEGLSPDNVYRVRITARYVDFLDYNPPFSENDFFPDNTNFKDGIGFYLGIVTLSEFTGEKFNTWMQKEYPDPPRNNSTCPGAKETLKISAIVDPSSSDKDNGIFSCNSIEPTGGGGGGPFNMAVGFLLVLLVSRAGRDNLKRRKTHGGD